MRDILLYIIFKFHPAAGEKTETKEWKKDGKWEVVEHPIMTDNHPKRWMVDSSDFIINISKRTLEKNRTARENDEVMLHYFNKYAKEIATYLARNRPEILDELLADKRFELRSAEENKSPTEAEAPIQEEKVEVKSVDESQTASNIS